VYLCPVEINFNNGPDYVNPTVVCQLLKKISEDFNKEVTCFTFHFVGSTKMLELNKSFLDHDTHTDVITFDYSTDSTVSGEAFLSLEMIEENAKKFSQTLENESHRLCVHSLLHCYGVTDKTTGEKKQFRLIENKYLNMFHVEPQ
jgi:probable rRNA maturation factor